MGSREIAKPQAAAICGYGGLQPSEVPWKASARENLLLDQRFQPVVHVPLGVCETKVGGWFLVMGGYDSMGYAKI
ncbi:hypothetical protein AVEN_181311-1 [Araneus ventricosus]|uniref:Uncharacterized protein n=1 Tax=Araneus ventricosus TaxID=182803 RepID=A0A4Y2EJG2_ARAVE|nr:hypothetical protein AVEN_181311-1 [Araneus ventricosus]